MNDNDSKLVWFFAGVAAGAAAGVLLAPQSGVETRRRLSTKAEEEGREWVERGREFYEKGKQLADDAADYFEEGRKLVEG